MFSAGFPTHPDFQWIGSGGGSVPANAVSCGYDNGEPIYVGRAHHNGALIPGKVHASHGCCYVPWGGDEHSHRQYEVLCSLAGQANWENVYGGQVPPQAVQAGRTEDGEPLYVGRRLHNGSMVPGKVQPSHSCLYIPYAGKEHSYRDYEVLVSRRSYIQPPTQPTYPIQQPTYPTQQPNYPSYPGYPSYPAPPQYPGYPGTCPPRY